MPFIETLRLGREQARRRPHPWENPIQRLRGRVGSDGVERVTTQAVFDFLDVPQRARSAAACSALAKKMRNAGWTPIRFRGLTRGGFLEQIRGYAREAPRPVALRRQV